MFSLVSSKFLAMRNITLYSVYLKQCFHLTLSDESIPKLNKWSAAQELRTPNEGIHQRYLKNWANVADKICFGRT
jgi:hypothetical protein